MDDEVEDAGFDGLAWYALGRMSAQTDHVRSEAVSTVLSRFRAPQPENNRITRQGQSLAAENAELRRQLENYKHNYGRLKKWADEAEQKLKRLGALED